MKTFKNQLKAGIAGTFVAGMLAFGAATPANASVLVDSIIQSTETDNPTRFCWELQQVDPNGHESVLSEGPIDSGTLDTFRGGTLTFGPNFKDTNIDVPSPDPNEEGYTMRLHRVACPEPVVPCAPGADGECQEEHGIRDEMKSEEGDGHAAWSVNLGLELIGHHGHDDRRGDDRHGGDKGHKTDDKPAGKTDGKTDGKTGGATDDKPSGGKSDRGLSFFEGRGFKF